MPARFAAHGDLHAGMDDAVWSIERLLEMADRDEVRPQTRGCALSAEQSQAAWRAAVRTAVEEDLLRRALAALLPETVAEGRTRLRA